MWHIAKYEATSLFSLRPYNATTSGGKTLVTPTPFAFKMALLDVAIRTYGFQIGQKDFPFIRDLKIAIKLPRHLVVNNTFIKILRPYKGGKARDQFGTGLEGKMGNTIAYRELVYFGASLEIAVKSEEEEPPEFSLDKLFSQVNYLGKRGGFMQFEGVYHTDSLPLAFTLLTPKTEAPFSAYGLLQMLDDCGPKMTFDHADIYNKKSIGLNKANGRILKPVVLPYRSIKSSRGFTLYERISHV